MDTKTTDTDTDTGLTSNTEVRPMLIQKILDAGDVDTTLDYMSRGCRGDALQDEIRSMLAALDAAGCPTGSVKAIDSWASYKRIGCYK